MPLSTRIRRHLQTHIVGYLALFVALSGTALALPGHKTVKGDDLSDGAVKKRALASGAVVSGKLAGGSVKAEKLAAGAVGNTQLGDDAVDRKKIKAQAVAGSKIADSAVSSAKVEDGTLQAADFGAGQLSDGFVINSGIGQTFSMPRAGRVYVIATAVTACNATPCHYGVLIDSTAVTGATVTLNETTTEEQVTLIGLTGQLAAGNHLISLIHDGDLTLGDVSVGGILLQ